jgi:hypothetical protein
VHAFIVELMKPERSTYIATFLPRLTGGGVRPHSTRSRTGDWKMTPSQHKIVDLCARPEGARTVIRAG